MGDRSEIVVMSETFTAPIAFYGHWSGTDNLLAVKNVLERTDRVGDSSYLAAQLFYEFSTLAKYDGNLSFGISSITDQKYDSHCDNPTIYVDADTGICEYEQEKYTLEELQKLVEKLD